MLVTPCRSSSATLVSLVMAKLAANKLWLWVSLWRLNSMLFGPVLGLCGFALLL